VVETRGSLPSDVGVGAGVGVFSGAFGVGGGLILVPFLVMARRVPQKAAQATSLVMVSMAAVAGALRYAFGESVAWLPAVMITVGGLVGAYIGAHIVQRSRNATLQALFGGLVVLAGIRMLWPQGEIAAAASQLPDLSLATAAGYAAAGLGMGLLSALFGIGGGILLVPVLVAVFGFSPQLAAGTSLAVMVPISLVGAIRLSKPGLTDWMQGARFGTGAIIGAIVGASIALAVSGSALRIGFAILMLIVGGRMSWSAMQSARSPDPDRL